MHFQGSSEVNIVDFLHWTLYNSKMEMLNMLADTRDGDFIELPNTTLLLQNFNNQQEIRLFSGHSQPQAFQRLHFPSKSQHLEL